MYFIYCIGFSIFWKYFEKRKLTVFLVTVDVIVAPKNMTKMSIYSNQNNVMIFELKDRTVKGFPLKYILGTWNCIAWQKLYSIDHLESFKLLLCFLNAGLCICTFGIGYILKQKVIYVSEPSEKRNIKMRSVWGRRNRATLTTFIHHTLSGYSHSFCPLSLALHSELPLLCQTYIFFYFFAIFII